MGEKAKRRGCEGADKEICGCGLSIRDLKIPVTKGSGSFF
jgi:hypothetical protein